MKSAFRSMPALFVAAMLALPGIGSEGGEGAGGTGVWILPVPRFVGAAAPWGTPPIQSRSMPVAGDLTLTGAPGLSGVTAVLMDDLSGVPLQLPVSGRDVTIERALVQGLVSSGVTTAHVVIADANQLGYVVSIAIDPATSSATLLLR